MSVVLEYQKDGDTWFAVDEDDDGAVLMMGQGRNEVTALIDLAEKLDREWASAIELLAP